MAKNIVLVLVLCPLLFNSCLGIWKPKLSDLEISGALYDDIKIGVLSGQGIVGKIKNNFSFAAASNIWISAKFYAPNNIFDSSPEQELPLIMTKENKLVKVLYPFEETEFIIGAPVSEPRFKITIIKADFTDAFGDAETVDNQEE